MAWRDWINSGGLFGGFRDYGQGLDPTALDRANRYGMAAAAAAMMKSDPYDTRYGTKLFGSLLAGKMAMRDQLAEQQELLAKKRAAEVLAARQEQEWEWKKAEAERKEAERRAKMEALEAERTGKEEKEFADFESKANIESQQSALIANRTGLDDNIILALSPADRERKYNELLFPKPKAAPKPEKPPKTKVPDVLSVATSMFRSEKIEDVDPLTGKIVKKPAFESFEAALSEARKRIAAISEDKVEPNPLAAFAARGLAETDGDEDAVLNGLIAKGYTKSQAMAAIEEAKRMK